MYANEHRSARNRGKANEFAKQFTIVVENLAVQLDPRMGCEPVRLHAHAQLRRLTSPTEQIEHREGLLETKSTPRREGCAYGDRARCCVCNSHITAVRPPRTALHSFDVAYRSTKADNVEGDFHGCQCKKSGEHGRPVVRSDWCCMWRHRGAVSGDLEQGALTHVIEQSAHIRTQHR